MKKNYLKYFFITSATIAIFGFVNEKYNKDSIVRIDLLTASLIPEKKLDKVEIKQIDLLPLQKVGLHTHPVPVVGYIAEGEIYFQLEGEQAKILQKGEAFYEPSNVKVLHFDNPNKSEKTTFIAYYLMDKNDKTLIEMLDE